MRWNFPQPVNDSILEKYKGIDPFLADILYQRNIEPEKIQETLDPLSAKFGDPRLLPNMEKAIQRIKKAYDTGEQICIYSDYDCDGTTSQAILYTAFKEWGFSNVMVYTPHRIREGYGLREKAIKMLADEGASLLITLDLGTSNVEQVEYAKSLGVDIVIFDHHEVDENPDKVANPYALVNAHMKENRYPYQYFAAAGLTYMLVCSLSSLFGYPGGSPTSPSMKKMRQLAAIGTVGDVMPITGENRILVEAGLQDIHTTRDVGIKAMSFVSGITPKDINERSIGFDIGPRINAAGRLYSSEIVKNIFLYNNKENAYLTALILDKINNERKVLSAKLELEAFKKIDSLPSIPRVILLRNDEWQSGTVGLTAGKVRERYNRPILAFSCHEGLCKGSARSIPKFDIATALRGLGDLLVESGGHPTAAGFKFKEEDTEKVRNGLIAQTHHLLDEDFIPTLYIDKEVTGEHYCHSIVSLIDEIAPFGKEYEAPVFLFRNASLIESKPSKSKVHLNLRFELPDGTEIGGMAFGEAYRHWTLTKGKEYDVCGNLQVSRFRGANDVQINILDFRPSDYIGED